MERIYDVCIVGGGASGLTAAVYIKQNNKDLSVAVLERLARVGKKLITTGNGRCNITNSDEDISHYHGENVGFAEYALKKYNNAFIEDFFLSLGVPFCGDGSGRMYPASLQASSVVDALRFSAEAAGVEVFTECDVADAVFNKDVTRLNTSKGDFKARVVIFAAGLFSGGAKLGCNGDIFKMLKGKGYKTVRTTPAIVQIKTDNTVTRQLKGIKVNASAALFCGEREIDREEGEVLFCDYGLSGPPILRIAREIERQNGKKAVSLDLMPDKSQRDVVSLLVSLKSALSYRKLEEYLSGALNKRVGQAVLKGVGLKLSDSVSSLKESDIKRIAAVIKNMRFNVLSSAGFDNSQVTAGGLDTSCFSGETMMSLANKNVYAIGEILDIDGDCGGYNLHFAFSSAFCAGDSVLRSLNNDKA